ncbi:LCP family protein [Frigoribacterium sp. CFBP 13712]|uniref:LCP family protein n=1 Tax=Frigoribacterium sp. CFBP 13712 TaxID=2775309 RepID=UPI00177CA9A9|nr:LCP family protein [Frigoribacterium sp. CFBP 13712]MBD8704188.1 LCP family protein [Frigoribacterium sp. CFBP 13712]
MPGRTTPTSPRGIARHGRLRRRGPVRPLLALVAGGLAVVLVSGASVAAIAVRSATSEVSTVVLGNEDTVQDVRISEITGGANILLVGTDVRAADSQIDAGTTDGARNDVTILVHLSEDHSQMSAVSFPRDMIVSVPDCTGPDGTYYPAESRVQFNTTLDRGGLSCTVSTVESITGLAIPYASAITFDGVIEMSNALGGVDVCVAQQITDTDSGLDLSPGTHSLQGVDALAFLRTRHGVGDGSDLARISSQQVFLSAMMRQILSVGTLSNPATLYKLASAALSNMELSSTLNSPDTLVQLAYAARDLSPAEIVFVQYPVVDDPYDSNRVVASEADAATLNAALAADTKFTVGDESNGRASVAQDPSAAPSAPASPSTPAADAEAAPTAPATEAPVSTLPSTISGQTAAEETCSVGNG